MISSKNFYSNKYHQTLKAKVTNSYDELITDIRSDLKSGFDSEFFSPGFLDTLSVLIKDPAIDRCTPLSFYWSNLLENLVYLTQLLEELSDLEESGIEGFNEVEEEIFAFWNDSEFAQSFLELLNDGKNISEVSNDLKSVLENQVLSFMQLHLTQKEYPIEEMILYNIIPEIGDNEDNIYLTNKHLIANFEKKSDIYPTIGLTAIPLGRKFIEVEISSDEYQVPTKTNPNFFKLDGLKIDILPSCQKGKDKVSEHKAKIRMALEVIKTSSPECFEVFKSFTHTIIPIDEPGIVSFSQQQLPGYSSINMFERDFLDLVDDLLHENGHHYLNAFLNHTELINEDDDKIFYSPWRRALRPIRGIYHASFTFFWALKIYSDLFKSMESADLKEIYSLSNEEKEKICFRLLEEYAMLTFCIDDLQDAFESGKVTPKGNDLILSVYELISDLAPTTKEAKSYLEKSESEYNNKFNELMDHLKTQKEHYKI